MSEDEGEEFVLTDKQFETMMNETIDELLSRAIMFAQSPKEPYHDIAREYRELYDNYKDILKGYRRRKKLGIEVVPTVRFNHDAGIMLPGYRHKDSVDRFNKWYETLKSQPNNKKGMYG